MADTNKEKKSALENKVKSSKSEDKIIKPSESSVERVEKLHESMEEVENKEIKEKTPEGIEEKETESKEEIKEEKRKEYITKEEKSEIKDEKSKEKEIIDENKEGVKAKKSTEQEGEKPVQRVSDSVPCCPKSPRQKIIRNQSDIFSLKDVSTTLQTSIFSINGSPSRRLFRKQEPAGHIFQGNENPPCDKTTVPKAKRITKENYNDEKRPSSSYRNPLTGSGLSSNDEYKSKGTKRKDGNPLLGLGYDAEVTSVTSEPRIPPGGHSHRLW